MKGTRFHELVGGLRAVLAGLPDRRKGKNLSYAMADFGLSAFSVFFTQSPSPRPRSTARAVLRSNTTTVRSPTITAR